MRRLTGVLLALVLVSGCGGGPDAAPGAQAVVVSAASSLKRPFTTYGDGFGGATVRLSFAGSDELAAQIRQGVKPDVFASANTKLPDALYREGLVEEPVTFTTNELVLAATRGEDAVRGLDDLAAPGTTIALGAEGVPVGDYARTVLGRLPAARSKAILGNVRSEEPDVGGVVGKLTQGAVDAGFVYRSDVEGAGGRLRAIELPADLRPTVAYGAAVVKGAPNPSAARGFLAGLLDGPGAVALEANGFGPAPGR